MTASRRISVIPVMVAMSVLVIGAAVAVAVLCSGRPNMVAIGPKAVVDKAPWDLGRIESGVEFGHTFIVRNEGDQPLQLAQGKGLCQCMVADVPNEPIPPGKQAKIRLVAADSVKNEPMSPGLFARRMHLLTNDPDKADIILDLIATVVPRVVAEPSVATLALSSTKGDSRQKRSAESLVYSKRWDRFELSVAKTSRKGIEWRIERATRAELEGLKALDGYRVVVTMPPDMPDGRFADWVEFAAKSAAGKTASCRLEVEGRVDGRLTFYGPKIVENNVLRLGTLTRGKRVRETLLMKVADQHRRLTAGPIETEPAFLHARLLPYPGAKGVGLYRIEVEIPSDAPSCAFTGAHRGMIQVKTDDPRLPVIELKVDFVLVGGSDGAGRIAAR